MTVRDARRRRLLFAWLYFTEGAPMGWIWWALPVQLAAAGVPAQEVAGLLALLVLPWGLKLFWAPAVDVLAGPRFGRRHWIATAQVVMALALVPLLGLDPALHLDTLRLALLVHAAAAATQDGAIDGLAVSTTPVAERGAVNGWMQAGLLTSRSIFGGGVVLLAGRIDPSLPVIGLIVLLLTSALGLLVVPVAEPPPRQGSGRRRAWRSALVDALRRRATWAGLALALGAGAGFKSLTALAGPLLVARGADEDVIGTFFLGPAVIAMALGALLGGRVADGGDRRRAVAWGEGGAALLVAGVGLVTWALPEAVTPLLVLLGLLYLAIGVATSSLYALLMDLTRPAAAVTQFAMFMAGVNLCESWSTFVLGRLQETWGWGPAVLAMAAPSALTLIALRWITPDAGPARAAED